MLGCYDGRMVGWEQVPWEQVPSHQNDIYRGAHHAEL